MSLYLDFAALYIAQAFDIGLSLWQQIGLLLVALITSKGSAGVAGSGFIIHRSTPRISMMPSTGTTSVVNSVAAIMSTMRGIVSLCGQMLASIVVSKWEGVFSTLIKLKSFSPGPRAPQQRRRLSRR